MDDVDSLFALDSDPDVMRYISDGQPCTKKDIEQAIPHVRAYYQKHPGFGIWLAELKDNGNFIGWACLKHLDQTEMIEAGFRFVKDSWNQGYATEAAKGLIRYGFKERGLSKIVAITHPENKASQHVLEKCGFKRNGTGTFYESECFFFDLSKN